MSKMNNRNNIIKRRYIVLGVALAMTFLTACGNGKSAVDDVLENQASEADITENLAAPAEIVLPDENTQDTKKQQEENTDGTEQPDYNTLDVDLTELSSTMVYSEVYNMMCMPDDYRGKVVKIQGTFNIYEDPATGKIYYACIISDATACCSQGMEFLPEGLSYPKDFPKLGSEITVIGVYETYNEGEYMYCRLGNARIDVEK